MWAFERAWVGGLNLADDLGDAVGPKERCAFAFFDVPHLFGDQCTLVQKGEELLVNAVDLYAQTGEI